MRGSGGKGGPPRGRSQLARVEWAGTAREVALSLGAFGPRWRFYQRRRPSAASYVYVVVSADARVKRVRLNVRVAGAEATAVVVSLWPAPPSPSHPGVHLLGGRGRVRAGGPASLARRVSADEGPHARTANVADKGWARFRRAVRKSLPWPQWRRSRLRALLGASGPPRH